MLQIIKVSAQSRSTVVADAVAGMLRDNGYAEVQAIGAGAINQAVKAITIARTYLQRDNLDLAIVPSFADITIDGSERTAIHIAVFSHLPEH